MQDSFASLEDLSTLVAAVHYRYMRKSLAQVQKFSTACRHVE